jgi:hypothetical protein
MLLDKDHLVGWNIQTDMRFDDFKYLSNCSGKVFSFSVLLMEDHRGWNPQCSHLDTDLCVAIGQPPVMIFENL